MNKLTKNGLAAKLSEFEEALLINKDELDEALEHQADLLYRAGEILALQISKRDAAKQVLDETEAHVDIHLRGGEKMTEKQIESLKRTDGSVVEAADALRALKFSVAQWSNMKEAIEQRGYALKELVSLYAANYYATAGADVRKVRERREERRR